MSESVDSWKHWFSCKIKWDMWRLAAVLQLIQATLVLYCCFSQWVLVTVSLIASTCSNSCKTFTCNWLRPSPAFQEPMIYIWSSKIIVINLEQNGTYFFNVNVFCRDRLALTLLIFQWNWSGETFHHHCIFEWMTRHLGCTALSIQRGPLYGLCCIT